jgi:hypothetical protein
MGDFARSYAERDKSVAFSDWLANRLQQEIPDMPAGEGEKLSKEIISAVAEYDRTLDDLNKAIESGQSKEGWLADRVLEAHSDMPIGDAGKKLQQANTDLNLSNSQLMLEGDTATGADDVVGDWNEYSLKSKALEVGKQAVMSGLGAAMATVKRNMESGEAADVGSVAGEALQSGIEASKNEVKAVVAGALKAGAEKNLTKLLPSDTSTETICDMAGIIVENAAALLDVARGRLSVMEALDKTGRASVAAVCRWSSKLLEGKLSFVPVIGPVVVRFAGGLLEHMESTKFSENVYTLLSDAAKATWEGIKQAAVGMWNEIKNSNMVVQE